MKNWFKGGIYYKQLNVIAVLLVFLCIGQIVTWTNEIVDPVQAALDEKALVKGTQEVAVPYETVDEGGIQFDGPDGKTIMMPKEMRSGEKLEGFYENGIVRLYIDDSKDAKWSAYQIRLSDDLIEIWQGDRLVHVLTYNTSLGRIIRSDNEFLPKK